jgi:hypothetical protein
MVFTNPVELLSSVREAIDRGSKIELNDDPYQRMFGYKSPSETWMISITDIKRSLADPTKKELVELFKTPEGRIKLLSLQEKS